MAESEPRYEIDIFWSDEDEASIVILAERYGTLDILTLAERHFRAVTRPNDRPFRLLTADI